jgi:hypothetical protein
MLAMYGGLEFTFEYGRQLGGTHAIPSVQDEFSTVNQPHSTAFVQENHFASGAGQ